MVVSNVGGVERKEFHVLRAHWTHEVPLPERSLQVRHQLAEQVAALPNPAGVPKIIADIWSTGMDEKRLNEQGMAPLTGVPLPFLSYSSSNLVVLMGGMGLLLNIAATGGRAAGAKPRLQAIEGGLDADGRDRGRGHGRARRAGARGR